MFYRFRNIGSKIKIFCKIINNNKIQEFFKYVELENYFPWSTITESSFLSVYKCAWLFLFYLICFAFYDS